MEGWEAGPLCSEVHPGHVVVGSKHSHFSIHSTVTLHALVNLLGVVQHLENREKKNLFEFQILKANTKKRVISRF